MRSGVGIEYTALARAAVSVCATVIVHAAQRARRAVDEQRAQCVQQQWCLQRLGQLVR